MSDGRLWTACDELLTILATGLDTLAPDVQVVQLGPGWAWDPCERLVVHPETVSASQLAPTAASPESSPSPLTSSVVRPTARLVATLLVCIPKVGDDGADLPSTAAINTAAEALHTAGLTMWQAAARARVDGDWEHCSGMTVEDMTPTGAQGGYAGWRLPVVVDLTGLASGS